MTLAAALALYTVIALAPLVTVMLTIAGWALGEQASLGFIAQAEGLIGKAGGEAIRGIVENSHHPSKGALQAIIGFVILLSSASARSDRAATLAFMGVSSECCLQPTTARTVYTPAERTDRP